MRSAVLRVLAAVALAACGSTEPRVDLSGTWHEERLDFFVVQLTDQGGAVSGTATAKGVSYMVAGSHGGYQSNFEGTFTPATGPRIMFRSAVLHGEALILLTLNGGGYTDYPLMLVRDP